MSIGQSELTVTFQCHGETLVGVVHNVAPQSRIGVVIVVGGPQYRIGAHRQFVALGRALANSGIPVFRFDARGMGDSSGDFQGFENIGDDIRAAIDAFVANIAGLDGVILWGLCDAASAILFYAHKDARVRGIVLLNPWVRTEEIHARAQIRHYYIQRFLSIDFWQRLIGGRIKVIRSIVELIVTFHRALADTPRGAAAAAVSLPERMAAGLEAYCGEVLLILSENDLTAKEFSETANSSARWHRLLSSPRVARFEILDADHTFSRREWSDEVAERTRTWIAAHLQTIWNGQRQTGMT